MDNLDFLLLLTSRLDNQALEILSHTPIWTSISKIAQDQYFWYLRVQTLLDRDLKQRPGQDWKRAYYLLQVRAHGSAELFLHPLTVQILLEIGYDPSSEDSFSLRAACANDQEEVVALLLADDRTDPTSQNNYCIKHSIIRGYKPGILRLLLEDGRTDPTIDLAGGRRTLLSEAIEEYHNLEAVRLLLRDKRVDPSVKNNLALHVSVNDGEMDDISMQIFRLLLADSRVDPSAALERAAMYDNAEVMKILLADDRINLQIDNYNYVDIAMQNDSSEVLQLLLKDRRFDPSMNGDRFLNQAAEDGYTETFQLLLEDRRVTPSWNTMYLAVINYNYSTLKLLLEDGRVDPSEDDNALLREAQDENEFHSEVVELLKQDPRVIALL